jgi:hypothetical protein
MRPGHNQTSAACCLLLWMIAGCGDPCTDLVRAAGLPGWKPSENVMSCRAQLGTMKKLAAPFGSVAAWRTQTVGLIAHLFFDTQEAIARADVTKPIQPFKRWPEQVPCSQGHPITAEEWKRGPLAAWIREVPDRMPASFELDVQGGTPLRITLRAWQDLNCDGKLGLTQAEWFLDPRTHQYSSISYRSSDPICE